MCCHNLLMQMDMHYWQHALMEPTLCTMTLQVMQQNIYKFSCANAGYTPKPSRGHAHTGRTNHPTVLHCIWTLPWVHIPVEPQWEAYWGELSSVLGEPARFISVPGGTPHYAGRMFISPNCCEPTKWLGYCVRVYEHVCVCVCITYPFEHTTDYK